LGISGSQGGRTDALDGILDGARRGAQLGVRLARAR
jgi:hypothetical protein